MHDDGASLNRYSLVKGAARRARQLQSGATPLTKTGSNKACHVAQEEIRAGLVRYEVAAAKGSPRQGPA